MNMAVDEAILRARIDSLVPDTLRLYRWRPSAVSIGRFQKIEDEVQLENCRRLGVDVVRRITGGGTVYHDAEHEITYSVVASKEGLGTEDITTIYARIYAGLAQATKMLGVTTDFCEGNAKACPNLTVKGKKISGSAQSHKKGVVLQHGTLLIDVDLERMFTLLRVPWAKTCMQVVRVAGDRITSVTNEMSREVSIDEVNEALVNGFQEALHVKFRECKLTEYERALAQRLCKTKYKTADWNFKGVTAQEE